MELIQRRRGLIGRKNEIVLPDEYQRVEWIQNNSGNAYFVSDIVVQDGLTVDSFQTMVYGDSYLFGGQDSNSKSLAFNGFWRGVQNNYNGYYSCGHVSTDDTTIYHFVTTHKDGRRLVYQDGEKVYDHTVTNSYAQSSNRFGVFCILRNAGDIALGFKGKVYRLKVLKDAAVLANYIPCYRKTDGEVGMYDLVLKKFYGSEGSRKFAKGADV